MNTYISKSTNVICEDRILSRYPQITDFELMTSEQTVEFYLNQPPEGKQRVFGELIWEDIPAASIDVVREVKLNEVRSECEININAGFISDALGYDVHYRCTRDDQGMIRDSKTNAGGLLWRNETLTAHTSAQASKVFTAMVNHRDVVCKSKYALKMTYIIDPIRTIEEINAVTWDSNE